MQLVIISGKGGTGKTTIAASFAYLSENSIKCDCDVDASNLHIVLGGEDIKREPYIGAKVAYVNGDKCTLCRACENMCRFDAIKDGVVDELKCEGCAACTVVCDYDAITMKDEVTGDTIITKTSKGILSRAQMIVGAEGSGKLVTDVRKNALSYGNKDDMYILDGTPGVGCAVMASVTGCDMALIIVEPSQSGLNDFKRVLSVVEFFEIKPLVCINKYDINEEVTKDISTYCETKNIDLIGKIPFDTTVEKSINELKPIVLYENSMAAKEINIIWQTLNNYTK
ncbi:ATP-binding protein [Vallitalea sp.]|jgi:MinD superfamily P-loop ATPase|uniref:ATP-binding protein n=1 Tax=Vallitalea sp. TaxID=1882829 RepID=UPI0025D9800B|nr:ATP-binding protein [Vallitalea sp.]MCT4686012.1 ATP-binding protein [Vallitalea sp.]